MKSNPQILLFKAYPNPTTLNIKPKLYLTQSKTILETYTKLIHSGPTLNKNSSKHQDSKPFQLHIQGFKALNLQP